MYLAKCVCSLNKWHAERDDHTVCQKYSLTSKVVFSDGCQWIFMGSTEEMSELPQHCMSHWKGVLAAQEQPDSVSSHPKMPYLGCVQASFYGTKMVTWIHSSVKVHLAFSVGQCKAGTHGKYTQVLKIICLGCWIATVNIYTSIVSIGAYKASESAS